MTFFFISRHFLSLWFLFCDCNERGSSYLIYLASSISLSKSLTVILFRNVLSKLQFRSGTIWDYLVAVRLSDIACNLPTDISSTRTISGPKAGSVDKHVRRFVRLGKAQLVREENARVPQYIWFVGIYMLCRSSFGGANICPIGPIVRTFPNQLHIRDFTSYQQ